MTPDQAKKYLNAILDEIALSGDKIRSIVYAHIIKILNLSSAMFSLGPRFTFASSPEINTAVNVELVALSDEILNLIDSESNFAMRQNQEIEENDRSQALIYIRRPIEGKTIVERVDEYSSMLKEQLEGYIAAGLNEDMDGEEIALAYLLNIESPETAEIIRQARSHATLFAAMFIVAPRLSRGSGNYASPMSSFKRLCQTSVIECYDYAAIQALKRQGFTHYHVLRGSNYPCAICESMANRTYPIDNVVLPFHPNCVCYPVPVKPL